MYLCYLPKLEWTVSNFKKGGNYRYCRYDSVCWRKKYRALNNYGLCSHVISMRIVFGIAVNSFMRIVFDLGNSL